MCALQHFTPHNRWNSYLLQIQRWLPCLSRIRFPKSLTSDACVCNKARNLGYGGKSADLVSSADWSRKCSSLKPVLRRKGFRSWYAIGLQRTLKKGRQATVGWRSILCMPEPGNWMELVAGRELGRERKGSPTDFENNMRKPMSFLGGFVADACKTRLARTLTDSEFHGSSQPRVARAEPFRMSAFRSSCGLFACTICAEALRDHQLEKCSRVQFRSFKEAD